MANLLRFLYNPILRRNFSALPSKYPTIDLECIQINFDGSEQVLSTKMSRAEFCHQNGILLRDLRHLESKDQSSSAILPRSGAIIVNTLLLRALVSPKRAIFFAPPEESSNSLFWKEFKMRNRQNLKYHFTLASQTETAGYGKWFEFVTLETILDSTLGDFEQEIDKMLRAQKPDSAKVNLNEDLMKISILQSRKMIEKRSQLYSIQRSISDLLSNDADMSQMFLSEMQSTGIQRNQADHEEVELLLEHYLRITEDLIIKLDGIINETETLETLRNLVLDSQRNKILKLELIISLGSMTIAGSSLVAAFFGMNLPNSIDSYDFSFPLVSSILVMASILSFKFGFGRIKNLIGRF